MAEAFGVAAGLIGVVSLIIEITKLATQIGLDWKDAPQDVKRSIHELENLRKIVSETHLLLSHELQDAFEVRGSLLLNELGPHAPPDTETKRAIASCDEALDNLLGDLRKRCEGRKFGWERFKGPFLAQRTLKSVERLHRQCQTLNNMISIDTLALQVDTASAIRTLGKEQKAWYDANENQEILDWLSTMRIEEKHQDVFVKHHPGTAQWILDHDHFKSWRNGHWETPSVLWCPGIRKSRLFTTRMALMRFKPVQERR